MVGGGRDAAFDVVTVPDFSGPEARRFELQTLLFLAAFRQNAGPGIPLHLACIGEPPPSVARLAERMRAAISIHRPISGLAATANKLRGLEVPEETPQRLLVDSDVLVLGELSGLVTLGRGLAAAPVFAPRWPNRDWEALYAAVGRKVPQERIRCTMQELGMPPFEPHYPGQASDFQPMPPVFNSGVLWIPAGSGLRKLWEEYLQKTRDVFPVEPRWMEARKGDQLGLAMAVDQLREEGVPFTPLPSPFHAAWIHIFAGSIRLENVRLFHAFGLGHNHRNYEGPLPAAVPGMNKDLADDIRQKLDEATRRLSAAARLKRRIMTPNNVNSVVDTLRTRLDALYASHIESL